MLSKRGLFSTFSALLVAGLILTGCQDAVFDADTPEAPQEQETVAKMQQAFAETGMYVVPEEEYVLFGIELPDEDALDEEAGKNVDCDRATVPFAGGTLKAGSCASVELVLFQGGLYNLLLAWATNHVRYDTDEAPLPRVSAICSVTLRLEGSVIAENDCVSEPNSYTALNPFAILTPAQDGPYHYIRTSQHAWDIAGQIFAATTAINVTVEPIP